MLPSMPSLMTPIKELDDSSDTSDESPPIHRVADNDVVFESTPGDEAMQNYEANQPFKLNHLQNGDSETNTQLDHHRDKVISKHTPEKRSLSEPTSAQKKKKTLHKKTLAALTPDSDEVLESLTQNFAESYFLKVKSMVDEKKWNEFLQELVAFEERAEKQPAELYRKMEELLSPYPELVDEFLAFLLPHQALQVNRFMPYLVVVSMKELFRKMNILLMKKQVRQVLNALESLANLQGVTLADVKDTVLPLLKSSPLLTHHFLALLPGERPPDSLMTDFEQIDFKDDSLFETIIVPDCPDPYGNENCVCSCHTKQTTNHCVSCGIKYVNGRVYLQQGKVLKPAKVTFRGNKHLDLQKWEEDRFRSRRRFLPKAMLSPGLELRLNADSEDDCGVKKSPRTPRARITRPKVCKKEVTGTKEEEALDGIFPLSGAKCLLGVSIANCEMKNDGNEDHDFDDIVLENECNAEEDIVLENECNTEEEEEDLNRLHSENDSSLEAGDITKELESANDCSFEDEEIEDFDINSISPNEKNKTKTYNLGFEDCEIRHLPQDIKNKISLVKTGFLEVEVEFSNMGYSPDSRTQPELDLDNGKQNKLNTDNGSCYSSSEPSKVEICEELTTKIENVDEVKVELSQIKIENNLDEVTEKMDLSCEENNLLVKIEYKSPEVVEDVTNKDIDDKDIKEGGSSNELDNSIREWTREEDKIILQTFQHESGLEQTFETASLQLPNRSKEEIQERFEILLKLLKEMISDESNLNT